MAKRTRDFLASKYLHDARYQGELGDNSTLPEWEKKKLLDPDYRTRHQGTIHAIAETRAEPHWNAVTSVLKATEQSRRLALAKQRANDRRARGWLRCLPKHKRDELAAISPKIKAHIERICP